MTAFLWSLLGDRIVRGSAVVIALGILYRFGEKHLVKPPIQFAKRVERTLNFVEHEMTPNSGSSMVDKVNELVRTMAELVKTVAKLETRVQASERTSESEGRINATAIERESNDVS